MSFIGDPPIAADMGTTVWPEGPTRSISTFAGKVWLMSCKVRTTFEMTPTIPDTLIGDG